MRHVLLSDQTGAEPVSTSPIRSLPSALEREEEIARRVGSATPAFFLDYDGTLTPIVDDPAAAVLSNEARAAIERLRGLCPVAVVSGRDLAEVREMVAVRGIHYAGSHGFETVEPDGTRHRRGAEYLPALARGARRLEAILGDVPGAWVERKGFAVAVHFRKVEDPADARRIEEAVDEVVGAEPGLRKTAGKRIFELRPAMDWDKGKAILWILEILEGDGDEVMPLYLGDDLTDEDGFRALEGRGIGIVVRGSGDEEGPAGDGRRTAADYALDDPDAVRRFLEEMAGLLEGAGA